MDTPPVITGDDVSAAQQALRYELTTLSYRLPDADRVKAGIEPWLAAPDAEGRLLGCWAVGLLGGRTRAAGTCLRAARFRRRGAAVA